MSRKEFMEQLSQLLGDVPEAERKEALRYYEDYLEDAGSEKEADALRGLGSPAQVADSIRAGLAGGPEEGGSFSQEASDAPSPGLPMDRNIQADGQGGTGFGSGCGSVKTEEADGDGQERQEPKAMDMEAYMERMEAEAEAAGEKNASKWEIPEPSAARRTEPRADVYPGGEGRTERRSQPEGYDPRQEYHPGGQGYGPGNDGFHGRPGEQPYEERRGDGQNGFSYGDNGPGYQNDRTDQPRNGWQGQSGYQNGYGRGDGYQSQYRREAPYHGPWQDQGNGRPEGQYYGGGRNGYGGGYGDRPPYGPDRRRPSGRRGAGEILLLVLSGLFVLPIAIPLVVGALAAVLGIFLAVVVGLAALVIAGIAVLIAGIVMVGIAFAKIFVAPMAAVYLMGGGMICTGLGLMLTILMIWLMAKVVPAACRGFVNLCRWPFRKRMG